MTDHELIATHSENVAQTMRDTVEQLSGVEIIHNPGDNPLTQPHIVAIGNGRSIADTTEAHRKASEYLKPNRRRGRAEFQELDSLIAWARRFKSDESAFFAKDIDEKPVVTCIADYHHTGPATLDPVTGDHLARHCAHRAKYAFPLSREWKTWIQACKEPFDPATLGEFVEENANDVSEPTPAILKGVASEKNVDWENRLITLANQIGGRYAQLPDLISLSRSLQIYETDNIELTRDPDSGVGSLQFLNEHKDKAGKPIKIPNLFLIAIPCFKSGDIYRITMRLQYRKKGPSVTFSITPYNVERVLETATREALTKITDATGLPMFIGEPETA